MSYSKDISSLWLVFFLIISPTKSVVFIKSIMQTVGLRRRPDDIGELFITLECKSVLELMSHYTFIIERSGNSSSKKL